MGYCRVYGRRLPAAELYKRIEMIDADEVRRVAWEHLWDQVSATFIVPSMMSQYSLNNVPISTHLSIFNVVFPI